MNNDSGFHKYASPMQIGRLNIEPGTLDTGKIRKWLHGADKAKCLWMHKYIWARVSDGGVTAVPHGWTEIDYQQFIEWILCGEGYHFRKLDLTNNRMSINTARLHGADLFSRARNAWNQKLNRAKKIEQTANTINVTSATKKRLGSLASQHGLTEQEFLEILIDLMMERREVIKDLGQQRKRAKRAALATDLGLIDNLKGQK
ncbi:hypothetical protein [Saccharospirillum alexandrii]|uniref:hypothetical protein n=1 Tax=Saccharospirillum alexandrii TaxID=2448477 RepID=UPI0037361F04